MKMRCLIVDDEPLARKGLEDFVYQTPFLEHVKSLASAIETIEFLKENPIDILFLDIQMPDMTGVELIKSFQNPPQVIFTTAHREFALDGFELDVIDFLLKPFSYSRFLKAVNKIVVVDDKKEKNNVAKNHIFIKCNGMITKVFVDDITFIETAKDYIQIHTIHDKYLTLVSLKHIEEELPKEKFIRVHRYYLVGLSHIKKLEGNLIYVGDHKIKISRTLRNEVYKTIIGNTFIGRL
ncbi:LytTR family two component transcriptional regulator [Aquimarina sp. MAR_2010_214]|uniref:LytR/AlgR family response regulator transcription factor n=1 Tax=Aquimarina sp. MAR_2010_214 TaxID=1250026 RepID=UPI000C707C01|nr:LytTR family DNA-binding domain-containing protein [Aquimarina sp. MAR_2010_214]PKV51411.1 LytTR family two component transcriptional regulator [Aquimarina sp. MAR_2010_214]